MISCGEGGGGESGKIDCKGVVDEEARAREKVCLSDENPFDAAMETGWGAGEDGREVGGGDEGIPLLRKGVEPADADILLAPFFLLKGRRNDHSDSNWTDSNSEDSAE